MTTTTKHSEHCYECQQETEHQDMQCVPCRIKASDIERWLKLWSVDNLLTNSKEVK